MEVSAWSRFSSCLPVCERDCCKEKSTELQGRAHVYGKHEDVVDCGWYGLDWKKRSSRSGMLMLFRFFFPLIVAKKKRWGHLIFADNAHLFGFFFWCFFLACCSCLRVVELLGFKALTRVENGKTCMFCSRWKCNVLWGKLGMLPYRKAASNK